ncbi:superoxide dismutase family protein [Saccharopolyspora sp. 5N102]|uniref:superoxide dismutase family protein n=1 Tax=Saccharopolyspora sp. 5N102 TaxID=3375155 RepID=UPI00379178F3
MLHQSSRLTGSVLGLCTAAVLIAGCGGGQAPAPSEQPATQEHGEHQAAKQTSATFEPYKEGATAITYNPEQVPAGSRVDLSSERTNGQTKITVNVEGLQPNRDYGAHVHTKPCGPTGEDAGPHFQEKADPVKPSVDPAYANPQNEVWLDFHTDTQGNGTATAEGNWSFDNRQDAKSFVIHEMHTHTEPGKAGTAGGRLACTNATF